MAYIDLSKEKKIPVSSFHRVLIPAMQTSNL